MIYDLWFILYMLYDVVHVRYEMKGYMIYGIRICVYIYMCVVYLIRDIGYIRI